MKKNSIDKVKETVEKNETEEIVNENETEKNIDYSILDFRFLLYVFFIVIIIIMYTRQRQRQRQRQQYQSTSTSQRQRQRQQQQDQSTSQRQRQRQRQRQQQQQLRNLPNELQKLRNYLWNQINLDWESRVQNRNDLKISIVKRLPENYYYKDAIYRTLEEFINTNYEESLAKDDEISENIVVFIEPEISNNPYEDRFTVTDRYGDSIRHFMKCYTLESYPGIDQCDLIDRPDSWCSITRLKEFINSKLKGELVEKLIVERLVDRFVNKKLNDDLEIIIYSFIQTATFYNPEYFFDIHDWSGNIIQQSSLQRGPERDEIIKKLALQPLPRNLKID